MSYTAHCSKQLSDIQGELVVNKEVTSEKTREWMTLKPVIERNRGMLLAAARFVAEGNPDDERALSEIVEGSGNMDSAQDNKSLALLLGKYLSTLSNLKIGGTAIDREFLDAATREADEAIELLGRVDASRDDKSELVHLRYRLYTLSVLVIREIKKWAGMIFWDRPEERAKYYDDFGNGSGSSTAIPTSGANAEDSDLSGPEAS